MNDKNNLAQRRNLGKGALSPADSQGLTIEIVLWLQRRHQFWLWLVVIGGGVWEWVANSLVGLIAVLAAIPVIGPLVSAIAVIITGLDSAMLFYDDAAIVMLPTLCTLELLRRFKAWLRSF